MCHGQSPVAGTLSPAGAPGVWDCGQLLFQLLAALRLEGTNQGAVSQPKPWTSSSPEGFQWGAGSAQVIFLHQQSSWLSQDGHSSSWAQDTVLPQEQHIQLDLGLLSEL